MIQAGRLLNMPDLETRAETVVKKLLDTFWNGQSLGHSFYDGMVQQQSFLTDAGATLTAVTMLYETNEKWKETMELLAAYLESFREDDIWIESRSDDFRTVTASWTDQPVPSGVSLAETGLTRYAILTGKEISPFPFRRVIQSDFYNINALMSNDLFHLFTSGKPLTWDELPANSIQKRGEPETVCYNKVCRQLQFTPPGQ